MSRFDALDVEGSDAMIDVNLRGTLTVSQLPCRYSRARVAGM
ncbi:hypothetical protein QTN93_05445 [Sphingomonas aerolata]